LGKQGQKTGSGLVICARQSKLQHMARPLRIEFAGGLYHLTSRGDRREDIYGGDGDRRMFFDLFAQVCDRFNWQAHAYCLMTNHYHLLVETPDGNLSKGMRQLNGVYTTLQRDPQPLRTRFPGTLQGNHRPERRVPAGVVEVHCAQPGSRCLGAHGWRLAVEQLSCNHRRSELPPMVAAGLVALCVRRRPEKSCRELQAFRCRRSRPTFPVGFNTHDN